MSFRPSKASGEIKKNRTMNPKHIIIASISLLLAAACEEFQPVFTTPQNPPIQDPVTGLKANTTIAQLKQMYKDNESKPITITKNFMHLVFGAGQLAHPGLFGLKASDINDSYQAVETKREKAKFGILD